jgi:hypothetical protein
MIRPAAIGLAVLLVAAIGAGCGGGGSSVDPAAYTVGVLAETWDQLENHKQVEGWDESAWRDPAYSYVIVTIDSRAADAGGSPLQNAQLARIQTTKLHGYKEAGMRWIRLGGKPAVRWAFDMGEQANIRWFFEECGVSFVVRGTTGLFGFTALSENMRDTAATIKVDGCNE